MKKGYKIGAKTFKVHLDGFNLHAVPGRKEKESPRKGFLYWSDDGELMALRINQYKVVFTSSEAQGSMSGANIVKDAHSKALRSSVRSVRAWRRKQFLLCEWFAEHVPLQYAAQALVAEWLESFKEFPPRAKPASFTVDQIVESLMPRG